MHLLDTFWGHERLGDELVLYLNLLNACKDGIRFGFDVNCAFLGTMRREIQFYNLFQVRYLVGNHSGACHSFPEMLCAIMEATASALYGGGSE